MDSPPQVSDLSELEKLDIPELIAYLQAEFRTEYFKKVEEILTARVERSNLEKEEEIVRYEQKSKAVDDLEKELRVCRDRCSELSSKVLMLEAQNRELELLKQSAENEIAFQKERYEELDRRVEVLEKDVADLCCSNPHVLKNSELGLEEETEVSEGGHSDEGAPMDDLDKPLTKIKVEKTLSSPTKVHTGRLTENVIDIIDSENESEGNSKENLSNNATTLKRKRSLVLSSNEEEDAKLMFVSGIRRWNIETKWQNEVDMISSFDDDSRLCMRAVCALYRHHMFKEKGPSNQIRDIQRVSALVKFLLDGGIACEMKKSVRELESFDPNGVKDCRRLAKHYSERLFTIFQKKEDPFFP